MFLKTMRFFQTAVTDAAAEIVLAQQRGATAWDVPKKAMLQTARSLIAAE